MLIKIEKLNLVTKMEGLDRDLSYLFNKPIDNIISEVGNEVTIKGAVIKAYYRQKLWTLMELEFLTVIRKCVNKYYYFPTLFAKSEPAA